MGNFDWRKILGVEGSSLVVSPSEGRIVLTDDPLGKLHFFRPQEIFPECHLVTAISGEAAGGDEVWRFDWKGQKVRQGIRVLATSDSEVFGERRSNGSRFVGHLLVEKRGVHRSIGGAKINEWVFRELFRDPHAGKLKRRVRVERGWWD